MSITDELRKWGYGFCGDTHDVVTAIADRIDAEHESACGEAYGNGVQSVALPDMTAYVKLPVDADGEPIHIGDVMENTVCPSVLCEVTGVGAECFYGWDEDDDCYSQFDANCYRHHHAPTVEDVLHQFLGECDSAISLGYDEVPQEVFVKYAAKLRLTDDGKEQ